jgi:tripartite-type tricarboxylate transporter receptor subunit TctC
MHRRQFVLSSLLLGLNSPSFAQIAGKPLRLIVPFPPGGATDVTARILSEPLGRALGVVVVVDNRAGAGGSVGMAELAKAAPDGQTLGMATLSTHGVNPAVYKKLPYDPIKDFTPIAELVKAPGVLVVNATLAVTDVAQLISYAKANPDKLSFATPGNGTISHMWAELFKSSTGISMMHVPYRGTGPALNDVVSGQVPVFFDQVASSLPHINAGRLRALAVSWNRRLDVLPNVPTFAEVGLPSNNDPSWFGLLAPKGMAPDVALRLSSVVSGVLKNPEVQQKLLQLGLFATGSTPEEFGRQINAEIAKMALVAKTAHIELD